MLIYVEFASGGHAMGFYPWELEKKGPLYPKKDVLPYKKFKKD